MRALSHFLLILCSAGAAILMVWLAPDYVPGLSPALAPIFAGFVFGFGCMIHLAVTQMATARRQRQHVSSLEESLTQLFGNQQRLARAIDRLDVTVGNLEGQAPQNVGDVVAEVKVLQSLVERLYSARSKESSATTGTAGNAGSTRQEGRVASTARPAQSNISASGHRNVVYDGRDGGAVASVGLTSSGLASSGLAASGLGATGQAGSGPVNAWQGTQSTPSTVGRPAASVSAPTSPVNVSRSNARQSVAETPMVDSQGGNSLPMPPVAEGLDERTILDLVRDGLRENGVELALQPIVSLPQRKRRYYECFSPIRAGADHVLLPGQYIDIAERHGLITAVDNLMLFRCIQLLRRLRRTNTNAGFFLNISHHTLADRDFFQQFIAMMSQHVELAPNLVFEFAQRGIESADQAVWADLGRLAQMGFRFSIDHIYSFDIDVADLSSRHVRFLKFGADTLLSAVSAGQIGEDPSALKRILDSYAIDLVVDRIESETVLRELLDLHIDFGQGNLFGEPRLVRSEISVPGV